MKQSHANTVSPTTPSQNLPTASGGALVRMGTKPSITTRRRFDDRGASAVEYALLIAGIAAVIIVSVAFVGKTVSGQFSKVGSSIANTK